MQFHRDCRRRTCFSGDRWGSIRCGVGTRSAHGASADNTAAPASTKEYEGRDEFTSDGQQLGKVAKTNTLSDANIKDIEVQSAGFLGFYSTTYVVPVGKNLESGRADLSITSEQAKQLTR